MVLDNWNINLSCWGDWNTADQLPPEMTQLTDGCYIMRSLSDDGDTHSWICGWMIPATNSTSGAAEDMLDWKNGMVVDCWRRDFSCQISSELLTKRAGLLLWNKILLRIEYEDIKEMRQALSSKVQNKKSNLCLFFPFINYLKLFYNTSENPRSRDRVYCSTTNNEDIL
jgi:hypothetical protein